MTLATKQDAMDAFEATRADWLLAVRAIARQLGQHGTPITVNDVRNVAPELPPAFDPRVWGAVFTQSEWENIGYTKSARKVSHGRPVARFVLRGAG